MTISGIYKAWYIILKNEKNVKAASFIVTFK